MISKEKGSLDQQGILIVEESIETAKKFQSNKPTPDWTRKSIR